MSQTSELPAPNDLSQHQDSLAVMAYRMGAVERNVATLVERFDGVAQFYVTNATLMLTLNPLKERIEDLEKNEKEREKTRSNEQSQFRLAITVAVLSPMLSIVINLILNTK